MITVIYVNGYLAVVGNRFNYHIGQLVRTKNTVGFVVNAANTTELKSKKSSSKATTKDQRYEVE